MAANLDRAKTGSVHRRLRYPPKSHLAGSKHLHHESLQTSSVYTCSKFSICFWCTACQSGTVQANLSSLRKFQAPLLPERWQVCTSCTCKQSLKTSKPNLSVSKCLASPLSAIGRYLATFTTSTKNSRVRNMIQEYPRHTKSVWRTQKKCKSRSQASTPWSHALEVTESCHAESIRKSPGCQSEPTQGDQAFFGFAASESLRYASGLSNDAGSK